MIRSYPYGNELLQLGRPSRSALRCLEIIREHEQMDLPRILDFHGAFSVFQTDMKPALTAHSVRVNNEDPCQALVRWQIVGRTKFLEELLREGKQYRQYISLGAGTDFWAYKMPYPSRVVEVDHPSTQSWKIARLASANVVPIVETSYIAADLSKDTIKIFDNPIISASLFSLIGMMGVAIYLEREVFERIVETISEKFRRCKFVFDFMSDDFEHYITPSESAAFKKMSLKMMQEGEPWKSLLSVKYVEILGRAAGFDVEIIKPKDFERRFFLKWGAPFRMCSHLAIFSR